MADFTPDLESDLEKALEVLNKDETVVIIMEDMISINEHFQACLDWFKAKGNKMRRRFGPGCFLQRGVVYFVGADTYRRTRGVALTLDFQAYEPQLIRTTGLEAKLRAKEEAQA